MWKLLREYSQVLVVTSDNVGSNQINGIRRGLKGDSVVVMGKNSMMRRSFMLQAQKTGNKSFLNLIPLLRVVDPLLMCPKYLSYESYRNCSYMQSGQLPLGLKCCNQQSSQDSEPFLVSSKFTPHQHCALMRSKQFLAMSVWSPLLLLAGSM
ncbi:hypothetical protein PIB30_011053 [Stylosanthes scabra]|uniref:Uncharacterized protein n=1 Tax=Stylosanthes scabra TaxID=79078 RepID=A0ABU6W3R7_9FABA|nr:hypothetical protein [Stylosanthes scabra]